MFLKDLHLKAYGHFTDRRLALGDAPGLVMITGRNEAGKSTLLRAITGLLFGFPHRAEDNFLHSNSALRVGATLAGQGEEDLVIYRRRGNNATLLAADDTPLDGALLTRRLTGVSETFFRQVMGLDHARLREHGETLLREEGLLGFSLFEAGLGVGAVRSVIARFDDEARALYRERGQKQPINTALRSREDQRRALRQATLRPAGWRQRQEELDGAEGEAAAHADTIGQARLELAALERIGQTRETLIRLMGLREKLAALSDAPDLPESAPNDRQDLERRLERLKTDQRNLEERVQAGEERLKNLNVDTGVLAAASRIKTLVDQRGRYLGAREDRIGLDSQVAQTEDRIRRLIRECRLETTPETVATELPRRAERQVLRRLIEHFGRIDQQATDRRTRQTALRATVDELVPKLAAQEAITDPAPLEKSVRAAQAYGDIAAQERQARDSRDHQQRAAEHALEDLPLFNGDARTLARLPVPMPETCQRIAEYLRAQDGEIAGLEDRRAELLEERRSLGARLQEIAGDRPPLSETDLLAARARRDESWSRLQYALLEGESEPGAATRVSDQASLLASYPATVAEADTIADTLRADADRIAQYTVLAEAAAAQDNRLAELEDTITKASAAREVLETEWHSRWAPTGLTPGSPSEMRSWLDRRSQVLDAWRKAEEAARLADEITVRHATAAQTLQAALDAHGITAPDSSALSDLLALAVSEIDTLRAQHAARIAIEADLTRAREELAAVDRQIAAEAKVQADWRTDWADALQHALLPPETPVDQAGELLELLDELDEAIDRHSGLRQRLLEIDRFSEAFTAETLKTIEALLPGALQSAPDIAVETLAQAVAANEAARQEATRVRDEIAKATEAMTDLADQHRHLDAEARRLCEQAGCASLDDLPAVEARAAEKRASTTRATELEESLRATWENRPLAEIQAAIEAEDPILAETRARGLSGQVQSLQEALDAANQRVGMLRQQITDQGSDDSAAQASQQVVLAEDTIRKLVGPYLENALAAALLRRAVELYRAENQGPLLDRARSLFVRLTTGRFFGLSLGEDDSGAPVLMGLRADTGAPVGVADMSDGTRDQLFLALRLAVIEARAREQGPLPFIADDLLINFDDDRSGAAFSVLADLARDHGIQVLFLTHHPHMVDLARAAVPADAMTESPLDL